MNEQTSAWKSKHSVGKLDEIGDVLGGGGIRGGEETSDVMYGR